MANETTLALITSLLDPIREGALMYAQNSFVAPRLVRTFSDKTGFQNRVNSIYRETAVTDNLAESADLTNVQFDREALASLTPKEVGKQFIITDRRIETDIENVLADAYTDIGYTIGKKVEIDTLAQFSSLSGGRVGADGTDASMDNIYEARAVLEANAVPGPYVVVLHSYQWLPIFKTFVSMTNAAPLDIRNEAQRNYFIQNVADMTFVVSPLVPYGSTTNEVQTATVGGTPTGGTFKLSYRGAQTAAIAYNAASATVQAALEALRTIGTGNVTVSGSAGGPYTITFVNALAGVNAILITRSDNSLTGGTSPDVTIVQTTQGVGYATGAIFNRDAIALDLRRPMTIEPQRDASFRRTELNTTMVYAVGQWRTEWGVQIRTKATAPNT